jgi:hypothetical protein
MQKQKHTQESASIFYSYAHKDEKLCELLETHLSLLRQQGLITEWHDRRIDAGTDWKQAIDTHLMNASIILLLISPHFLASDYCYGIEMQRAMERHEANEAHVIPVLLRPVDWQSAPIGKLQALPKNGKPITRWRNRDEAFVDIVESLRGIITGASSPLDTSPDRSAPMLLALKMSDRQHLLDARLARFVPGTRSDEITDVYERIEQLKSTGGYLAITGRAGEGKTTLVAQLIASRRFGRERTPYHIIPFNPGSDHQVTLLRSLMASLAIQHSYLPNFWTQNFQPDSLAGLFVYMLEEISARGEQEVIFIDGLDQIKPDANQDERDLDFLPLNVPSGIVIVISTRPDDVLKPLQLRSPLSEYRLSKLTLVDANRILAHNNIHLRKELVDQLYQVTQQNALYIDLVVKALIQDNTGIIQPKEVLQRLSSNPENIFWFSVKRLGYPNKSSWKRVIKPVLGLLLATQESISASAMHQILGLEDEDLRTGLQQLNGLIEKDNKGKYYLYHLKLQEFLKENKDSHREEDIIISQQEEHLRHRQLADWCAGDDPRGGKTIWKNTKNLSEQERQIYARQYYIVHLYHAQEWEQLFTVLDEEVYEQAKLQHDSSVYSYAQDLDLGRRAAAWEEWGTEEAIAHLPHLWRYTLLQSSLASRADQYPEEAFRFLVILHQKQRAIGLAELLTQAEKKVRVLLHVAEQLWIQGAPEKEWLGLFTRASEVAWSIHDRYQQREALCCLIKAYALVHKWDYADELIKLVERSKAKTSILFDLVEALAQAQQWDMAEKKIQDIDDRGIQAKAFCVLGKALALAQQSERAEEMWTEAKKIIRNIDIDDIAERDKALCALGVALALAGKWKRAKHHMQDIESIWLRVKVLSCVIQSLVQTQQLTEVWETWTEISELLKSQDADVSGPFSGVATIVVDSIETLTKGYGQNQALLDLSEAATWTQQWKLAEELIQAMYYDSKKTEALCNLVRNLAQAQQWKKAHEVLRTIGQREGKIMALCRLGEALAQFGQWEKTRDIWSRTEHLINTLEDRRERSNILVNLLGIGQTLVQTKQWKYADRIWTQTQEVIDAIPIEQTDERVQALCNLAEALNQVQQYERTQAILVKAENLIPTIKTHRERSSALLALSRTFAQIGEWERAVALVPSIEIDGEREVLWVFELSEKLIRAQRLEQAEVLIDTMKWNRQKALYDLVEASAQAQQWEQTERIIHTLSRDNENTKIPYLCMLGKTLIQRQQWEQAEAIWTEVETRIHLLKESQEKDMALAELSQALIQVQQWKRSKKVIDAIEQAGKRINALCELGKALVLAQEWEQVDIVQAEMEVLALPVRPGSLESAEALCDWSIELIKAKRWKHAKKLIDILIDVMKFNWFDKSENLCVLVGLLAQIGQWAQANTIASAIKNGIQKIEALCEIGKVLSQTHQWEEADTLWTKTENLVTTKPPCSRLKTKAPKGLSTRKKLGRVTAWTILNG